MKVTADTNILVRITVQDNEQQAQTAMRVLRNAELVAVTLPCLCEFVWVLRTVYKFNAQQISSALQTILNAVNVLLDRSAVEAGLAVHDAGGDFADAVIAHEGYRMGSDLFISFDKKAIALVSETGMKARLLT